MITDPIAALGQIVAPPLMPLILASAPAEKPAEAKYSAAIAKVVGTACFVERKATPVN